MPKKRTPEDEAFARDFSSQLRDAYERAKEEGVTRSSFAASVDVRNTCLQDLLDGKSVPGVRSLALAVDRYGIDVMYQGTGFRAHKAALAPRLAEEQLTLPFVISAVDPRVSLKLGPVTSNTIMLGVQVKVAG